MQENLGNAARESTVIPTLEPEHENHAQSPPQPTVTGGKSAATSPAMVENDIDLRAAGNAQLIQQAENRIATSERNRETVIRRRAGTLSEYHTLANVHGFEDRNLPGFEQTTRLHEGQTEKSTYYLIAAIFSTIVAIVFGTYVSSRLLIAESKMLLAAVCTVVATAVSLITGAVLRAVTGAEPESPAAIRRVNYVIAVSGAIFLTMLAAFAWLRWITDTDTSAYLPILFVGIELSAILLAAAYDTKSRVYRWSARLDRKFHYLSERKSQLESAIDREKKNLEELKKRPK